MNAHSPQATGERSSWLRRPLLPIVALAAVTILAQLTLSGGFAGAVAADSPVTQADLASGAATESGDACVAGANSGPTIALRLRGTTGDEDATLVVTGQDGAVERVAVPVSDQFEVQSFSIPAAGSNQMIRVEFTNDQYLGPNYDRNLTVDWLEICGERLGTDTAESAGIWTPDDGCRTVRFDGGNTLHCNGYFAWGSSPEMPSTITVTVTARGVSGEEILDIAYISGPNLGTKLTSFPMTTSWHEYSFEVPRTTHVSDLNFEFNNDKYIRGVIDRNMIVQKIVFDGRTLNTLDPRTFVTGYYNYGECQPGNNNEYLKTTIIHCNGSFNFERGDPALDE